MEVDSHHGPLADDDRPASRRLRSLDVGERVAHENRLLEVDAELACRAQQQAGRRLPADAAVSPSVGAHIDALDMATVTGHDLEHPLVDRDELRGGDQPTADHGLVGHHHHALVQVTQRTQRVERAGEELQLAPRSHVVLPLSVDHPVAVEEDDPLRRTGHHAPMP